MGVFLLKSRTDITERTGEDSSNISQSTGAAEYVDSISAEG